MSLIMSDIEHILHYQIRILEFHQLYQYLLDFRITSIRFS